MKNTILVIDDSSLITSILSQHFENANFNVLIAEDGEAGLRTIRETSKIDVIICDINMPKMRGIEMFEKMREEGIHRNTPIFFLTTDGRLDTIKKLKSMGAAGFIPKGTEEKEIVDAIVKRLTSSKVAS